MQSGGNDTIISVRTDKAVLRANGQDLCFVEIEFADKDGNLKPYIEQRIEIQTIGDARGFARLWQRIV